MWIETITVRTAKSQQAKSLLGELAACRVSCMHSRPICFECYQNMEIANEISVQLLWNEKVLAPEKTQCGLFISRWFEKYGIVRHTIWMSALGASDT
ncbi:MAG: hypothetical protein K9K39_01350 [Desulfohalobiaceae bacterium]|nr:hypothetical protein [Desulfohalobiaceae bacterium]